MRVKKIVSFIVVTIFTLVVCAQEQHPENCPFGGIVDCTGQCGLFVDENGDGFCDNAVLSKQKTAAKQEIKDTESSVKIKKDKSKINKTTDKSIKAVKEDDTAEGNFLIDTLRKNIGKNGAKTGIVIDQPEAVQQSVKIMPKAKPHNKYPYHLWQVLISTLGLYILTFVGIKIKIIKKVNHRRFWNVVLGITCLVSCLVGVWVVFAKMYGWNMNYLYLMQIHVDFGISMTIVALIHILWHLNYWKNLFRGAGKK